MRNFDFIRQLAEFIPSFSQLHTFCDKAETFQYSFPEESAINARKALEWLVRNHLAMASVTIDKHETLNDMLKRPEMDTFINYDWEFEQDIRTVRKFGNYASHTGLHSIRKNDAFICLRSLYYVVCGFLYRWKAIKSFAAFDATLVPRCFPGVHTMSEEVPHIAQDVVDSIPKEAIDSPTKPITKPKESLESEAITRKCLIDYMLNEARWEILADKGIIQGGKACVEIKVGGMPTKSGIGYCDYVLFSRGGQPLAVIEAKSTIQDPVQGRKQAIIYAECLEKRYGVRPVIYYTNGNKTMVIDGMGYPDREVIAFHSHDDLEYIIQKRERADITNLNIDNAITDRPYQKTAIKSIIEWFNKKHRRGLLVLATGTGKTRISISLCKLLSNNNWIKNVLFLADRTELVKQARSNYENLLTSESMTSLSDDNEPDLNARFVFSTYQTMINYINAADLKFSVGHFDLIIIDEAHRSVFGKFGSIFQYFDSLLIGLTATPRDEIDKNTFKLLELEDEPNFEYTFEEAVKDGYLVPYKVRQYNSKIMDRGIKYDELTSTQREELETIWDYEKTLKGIGTTETYYRDIKSNEIFNYIINDDTIDNVLTELMINGLKVRSGEDIGKTIIFAYNHKHAARIVERFQVLFPERGANYCQLIDNQVKRHDRIIREFKTRDMLPQIAVSVDMLDTGIDVPEILNLVFFKVIKSKIKFEQMIGRGTRLCPNIFGPDKNKECFYIFDWCGNFAYFSNNTEDFATTNSKSLTERLFSVRLDITKELQSADHQGNKYDKNMHDNLKSLLYNQVNHIVKERKDARSYWNIIESFRIKDKWEYISDTDVLRLKQIGKFIPNDKDDEPSKKFDLIMLHLQLSLVNPNIHVGECQQIAMNIATNLEKMGTIPAVMKHIEVIKKMQTKQFWADKTLSDLEYVRMELRDIIKLIENTHNSQKFIIDIEDTYDTLDVGENSLESTTYKQRIIDYLLHNTNSRVLRKIQEFEQLTSDDFTELERILFEELGTHEDYNKLTDGHPYKNNIAAFIRVINGIDRKKAFQIYQQFINSYELTSEQELYLKDILNYISVNGDVEIKAFMEFPLNTLNWVGTFGKNIVALKDFVQRMHLVISKGIA